MNQDKDNSSIPSRIPVRAWRRMNMVSIGIVALSLMQGVFVHPVQAGLLVKVLFGNDTCTFLPDRPAPGWVNKRPTTADFVGVGSASRMPNQTDQIQAAEQSARTALASEIEVVVKETMTIVMAEKNRTTTTVMDKANGTTTNDSNTEILLDMKQTVDQTLMGSRIDEKWLDRENCIVHVLATATQASVEEARKKLAERLRKAFKYKNLMLFDRSDAPGAMSRAMRGHLEALFVKGNKLLSTDNGHLGCVDDPGQPSCKDPVDTIYAAYKVVLDNEAATPKVKRRTYKLSGNVRFKDRLIASFDVACQGTGNLDQDHLIEQGAAKSCFDKARAIIAIWMEGSE
jgi:hypothetical protein